MNIKENDTPVNVKENTPVTNKQTTVNARGSAHETNSNTNKANYSGVNIGTGSAVSIKTVASNSIKKTGSTINKGIKDIANTSVNKTLKKLDGEQEGTHAGYLVVSTIKETGGKSLVSPTKNIKRLNNTSKSFRSAKNAFKQFKSSKTMFAKSKNQLTKIKGKSALQKKLTKNSIVRKQVAKQTAVHAGKAAQGLIRSLKYALQAIKSFITFIGSSSVGFLSVFLCVALVIAVIASPFGIIASNDDGSLTEIISDVMEEYHNKIDGIKNACDYDEINISGTGPEWKDVLVIYITKYSDATADEAVVYAEFNDVNTTKLKKVFWDMCKIDYTFYNEPYTEKVLIPGEQKYETKTIDNWILNISITSQTAKSYAEKKKFSEDKMNLIEELLDPVNDQIWDVLLEDIPQYTLLDFGDFPFYDQTDYAHIPYGPGSVATDGCGPTAFAMVVSYLTGTEITPADIIKWCGNTYYAYINGVPSGTSWSFFSAAASHYGITLETGYTTDINVAIKALQEGKPVINAQGAGHFTGGGHFIVLRGLDENGNILVYDPNNGDGNGNNNRSFTKDEISAGAGTEEYWIFTSDLVTGGNVARQVWNYFTKKGLSKEVTAGIIGNMMRECGGDTLNLDWDIYGTYQGQKYYGLCQWALHYTPSIDGASVKEQCDHLWSSMKSAFNTYGNNYRSGFNYSQFKKLNVEQAAVAFAVCYERPGYEYNNYEKRRNNAIKAYNTFK